MVDAPVLRWKPPASDFALWPERQRSEEMLDWLEEHVGPVLATLDKTARSGFGMDFGRTGDLSVLLPYQTTQALRRRFPFGLELSNCPFDQQREALYYVGDRLPRLSAGKLDGRGNGQYLAEKAQQKRFHERMAELKQATGSDGRRLFAIGVNCALAASLAALLAFLAL